MLGFLERVTEVLTGDTVPDEGLVALVGAANQIGMNLRKKPSTKQVEFGLESGMNTRQDKGLFFLRVTVYGTTSSAEVIEIADRVSYLLKSKNLTDRDRGLNVAYTRQTRAAVLPESDFGHQAELVYEVKLTDPTITKEH